MIHRSSGAVPQGRFLTNGLVRAVLAAVDHSVPAGQSAAETISRFAAMFDDAAAISPEASVAIYSLGDAARLAEATQEIVDRMDGWGLIGKTCRIVDLGCGIGRVAVALAPKVASIIGIDVSPRMVDLARERTSRCRNVDIQLGSGSDLACVVDAAADCVLCVDSFPYIVAAGDDLVQALFREAARVLAPAGAFLVLNYSYRGDEARDRDTFHALCRRHGFSVERAGTADFRLWDGRSYLAKKA